MEPYHTDERGFTIYLYTDFWYDDVDFLLSFLERVACGK
jgi:hypothetical protein